MDLDIDQLERRTFPISRRGYDRDDVDAFLTAIASDYRKVVGEYREAIQAAKDAVHSAATDAAALSSTHTFENVGSHVASILATASQAAENLKLEAEQEAEAIQKAAQVEVAELRRVAETYYAEAKDRRAQAEQEAGALRMTARSDVDQIIAEAHTQAAQIEQEAKEKAVRSDRIARAKVETIVAEGRRDYEHLRSLQQQMLDRISSVEFLIQQARDGISGNSIKASDRIETTESA